MGNSKTNELKIKEQQTKHHCVHPPKSTFESSAARGSVQGTESREDPAALRQSCGQPPGRGKRGKHDHELEFLLLRLVRHEDEGVASGEEALPSLTGSDPPDMLQMSQLLQGSCIQVANAIQINTPPVSFQ